MPLLVFLASVGSVGACKRLVCGFSVIHGLAWVLKLAGRWGTTSTVCDFPSSSMYVTRDFAKR